MSASDEFAKAIFDKTPDVASKTYSGVKRVGGDVLYVGKKVLKASLKGICIVLAKGTEFTTENVMNAVREYAFHKTESIEDSSQNITVAELKQLGNVTKIKEDIAAEVMQYFDKYCQKYDIKYNAVLNERDPDNPRYMVFFNGRDDEIIEKFMKEASLDYMHMQKNKDKTQQQDIKEKKRNKSPKKESVRAKLAFFRARVAARDKEQREVEKSHQRSERQR